MGRDPRLAAGPPAGRDGIDGDLNRILVHERDDLLLASHIEVHERRSAEAITVAVVYGAEHMRSVVTRLRPLGYRVVGGDWLTVVEF